MVTTKEIRLVDIVDDLEIDSRCEVLGKDLLSSMLANNDYPILVIRVEDDKYKIIEGYIHAMCLKYLGKETVKAIIA